MFVVGFSFVFVVSVVFIFVFMFCVYLFVWFCFVFVVSVVLHSACNKRQRCFPCSSGVLGGKIGQNHFWSRYSASLCWRRKIPPKPEHKASYRTGRPLDPP